VRFVARLPEEAAARIDPDALRQILLNLLDNAVKYGPAGQDVVVAVEPGERGVRLVVEDRGAGVPPRERLRIFERFQRLERDRLSSVAGTGIGLAVVSDLAARMHGRAFVEDAPSGGARFVVELPA
jgi:signal transduction histidine kinase